MTARTLMIQGTSSSVGKSVLVAGLCRCFARRGIRVAPFKAQNMSNNAAVCADGSEIGRSQALQAAAARVMPTADLNPVLLKPEADARSQVIVNGRPWRTLAARSYFRARDELWPVVTAALDRLRGGHELVIIEGAGSSAEPNLQEFEIVNMAVARYARSPVVLVGDIERGGVFAQLLGTLWLLSDQERKLVCGLVVNKFRGDRSLFDDGVRFLERRSGVPVLGVVPWLGRLELPEEDAATLTSPKKVSGTFWWEQKVPDTFFDLVVIRLPHIANFDDFDPLSAEPRVRLRYVDSSLDIGRPAAIILPGTKSTIADLEWLHAVGLARAIVDLARDGTSVVGICGGFQMLGRTIRDPDKVESPAGEVDGLALLPTATIFSDFKQTHQVAALIDIDRHCSGCRGQVVRGYEIHNGRTTGGRPWLTITQRSGDAVSVPDGAVSEDGTVWGCYLHGFFANDAFRRAWLDDLAARTGSPTKDARDDSLPLWGRVGVGANCGKNSTSALTLTLSQREREHSVRAGGDRRHSCNAAAGEPDQAGPAERLEAAIDRLADGIESSLDMQRLETLIHESTEISSCQPI